MRRRWRVLVSLAVLAALALGRTDACSGEAIPSVATTAVELVRSGHFSAGMQALEGELRADPRCATGHALLALICSVVGDQEDATYHEGRAIRLGADDPAALALLAMARFAAGDPDEATSLAEYVLEEGLEDAGCMAIHGLSMIRDHPLEAYRLIERAHGVEPSDPWVLVMYLMATGVERGESAAMRMAREASSGETATYLTQVMCAEVYASQLNDVDAAHKELRLAMKTVPDDAMAIRYVGRMLVQEGHSGEARQMFASRSDVLGRDIPEQYWLGRAMVESGQYQAATRELKTAALVGEDDVLHRVALGEALLLAGDVESARWQFDIAAHVDTTSGRAHWLLASTFLIAEDYARARRSGLAATRHDSTLQKAWLVVGLSSRRLGDIGEAARCYARAARLAPLDYGLQRETMALLAGAGDWEAVLRVGEWIIGDRPWQRDDDALVHGVMVEAADVLDNDEIVLRSGSRLLQLEDAPFVALMTVAERFEDRGDTALVAPYLRAAEGVMPDDADAHELVARTAGFADLYDLALEHALRAVELDSTVVNAYLIASSVSNVVHLPEDGERFAREALALEPDSDAGTFDLGRSLVMLGRYQEAVEALVPLVERDPDRIGAGADLAVAWAALGELERAMEVASGAAEQAPEGLCGYPFSKVALYFAAERDSAQLNDVFESWSRYRLSHGIQDSVNELGAWKSEIRKYDW